MKEFKISTVTATLLTVVLAAVSFSGGSGCTKRHTSAATEPAQVYSAAEMAPFETLTKATLEELSAGNDTAMVEKLTDLETAWDDQEKVLKPRDPATWKLLDKTLDRGISALRSSRRDADKGKAALEDLLKLLQEAIRR